MSIQEIERAVRNLRSDELKEFRAWFENFDAGLWDKQLENDFTSGKLGAVAEKAVEDYKKGKFTEL